MASMKSLQACHNLFMSICCGRASQNAWRQDLQSIDVDKQLDGAPKRVSHFPARSVAPLTVDERQLKRLQQDIINFQPRLAQLRASAVDASFFRS